MKPNTPNQLLDELARESLGQDINLSSDLMIKVRKEKNKTMKKRSLITTFAAIVLVASILASVPSVVQAVKQLFGYIPGTGVVDQSTPMRILSEPVEYKSGETTINVSQALIDSEHVTLVYQIENLPDSTSGSIKFEDYCHELPSLKRADGSYLSPNVITGNSWASGLSRQLEFDSLSKDENTATLVFNCIEASPKIEGFQKIEMQLNFITAPADMKVYPIVALPTPTAQSPETSQPEADTSDAAQISLDLSSYVQTDENILLFGALQTNSRRFRLSYIESAAVHLYDKDGTEIPIEEDYTVPESDSEPSMEQVLPITYRTAGRYIPGKANLAVDSVWVEKNTTQSFTFDPGTNPQPGQTWVLNNVFEVDGYTILVKDATMDKTADGLTFSIEAPVNISNVSLMDLQHDVLGGGGGESSFGFTYSNEFPTGPITIGLISYAENLKGPWQAEVELPAFADGVLPTPMQQACLTQSSWTEALNSSTRDFPAGLGGQLILMDILPPDNYYHVMSAALTDSKPNDLGVGDGGSLSPDGKTLIYSTNDGLTFRDMSSGETHLVEGTSRRDRGALWSPDGNLIAFSKGPASGLIGAAGPHGLMLMNSDGSDQHPLLTDNASNTAQAWMPDGKSLVFTTMRPEGVLVQTINIETGKVTLLTTVNYQNASIAVSPDGSEIAYEAMLPGDRYSVYISNLDGSNARLIANADPIVVTVPQWSPDGQWLIMSVQDSSLSEYMPTLVLVNVQSCQIIPLTSLQGYVTSWR